VDRLIIKLGIGRVTPNAKHHAEFAQRAPQPMSRSRLLFASIKLSSDADN